MYEDVRVRALIDEEYHLSLFLKGIKYLMEDKNCPKGRLYIETYIEILTEKRCAE